MKQVSVFAPLGTLDHQTGILNAVQCFALAGYQVEVLAVRNRRYAEPRCDLPGVRFTYLPWEFDSEREPRAVATILFGMWVLLRFWRTHRVIFAGGIRGLLAAYLYSRFRRARIINYQTELYVGAKLDTAMARIFKVIERRAAQSCELIVEHSRERLELLVADLGVAPDRVVVVPNAPLGPARPLRVNYLHRRLELEESASILLCPGTIGDAFESRTVAEAAQALPDGWTCVLHSAQPREPDDPYLQQLRAIDVRGRVAFSLEPVPYSRIDDVIGSATIGLALYSSSAGQNYSAVGLASGKLSHFLKLGVPVIVSPVPSLARFVREHGVGEVLEHPAQLGELVNRIQTDLSGYRSRALQCFDQYLAYERSFRSVIDVASRWTP